MGAARPDRSAPGVAHGRRSSSLTLPGLLFVAVTLMLALGAINGQNNLLFWLFGFAIASVVISGIITGNALMSLRLIAHDPPDTEAGAELRIAYTLVNTSRLLPNFGIELREHGGDGKAGGRREPGVVAHLPPRSRAGASSRLVTERRGRLELGEVRARTTFPFGLFVKTIVFHAPRSCVVAPATLDVRRDEVDRVIPSDHAATRHMSRRGSGFEYFGIREYTRGDPLRRISWKHSARAGDLRVVEYPDPAASALVLELETPGPEIRDDEFERAVSFVYTIAAHAHRSRPLGLIVPWASVAIPPGTGGEHLRRIGRALGLLSREPLGDDPRAHASRAGSVRLVVGYRAGGPGRLVAPDEARPRGGGA